jgi:hypothetical protein
MDSTTKSSLEKKISDYFENASYNEIYSNDVWFTIIIILIVVIIVIYFYIKSTLVAYRNSWQEHKCNPLMMPFASIINSDKVYNNNDLEYIVNNFTECLNILNEEVAVDTKKPLNSILGYISNFFDILYTAFIGVKNFIVYLFRLLMYFFRLINNSIQNILLQLRLFFMNINDFLGKILSVFTVIYYTLILLIRSWKLMFSVLVMGWLLGLVIPISMMMIISLILLIITIMNFSAINTVPIIGQIIAAFLIILIIFYGGAFLVSIVVFTITMFIYVQFTIFLAEII